MNNLLGREDDDVDESEEIASQSEDLNSRTIRYFFGFFDCSIIECPFCRRNVDQSDGRRYGPIRNREWCACAIRSFPFSILGVGSVE